jgi:nitrous oxidase accessory protein
VRTLFLILACILGGNLFAASITVDPKGKIRTLREAVSMAMNGDTIWLSPGTYREGNIVISKNICLFGKDMPVLDGEGKHEILTVSGEDIVIRGIHFLNAGYSSMNDYAALKLIDARRVIVENNTFTNSFFAIHLSNIHYSAIRHNRIRGNNKSEQLSGNGIHLWKCSNMMVERNHVTAHRDGIYFEFVTASTIYRNVSEGNVRYGLHFMFSHNNTYLYNTFRKNGAGVAVMYTKQVRMENNLFDENWGSSAYGILLKDITDSYIANNTFLRNTMAIHMEGSSRIQIGQNEFRSNGWAIKVQASCDNNQFYQNNFLGNSFDVGTNGTVSLNRFYNNHWDKYEGYDMDKNGVGDIPFHPVSMYSMIVEQQPNTLILFRSFMVSLIDKAEKAIPSLTPQTLVDESPSMKPFRYDPR